MNPLLQLLLNSMISQQVKKIPEDSPFGFLPKISKQIEPYNPLSDLYQIGQSIPGIDRGLNALKDILGPAEYGTSQAAFESLSEPQQEYAMNLYQPGGILEGYNPVSAYGLGTLGTLQARENYMLDRAAAGKPYSETNLAKVQEAIQQLDSGPSDSGPSDSGGYGATGGEGPGAVGSSGMMGGGV